MLNNKRPYSVPEGYFDGLEMRLSNIPDLRPTVSVWDKIKPYAALAVCFGAIYLFGSTFVKKAVPATYDGLSYEQLYYSDLIPWTDPYSIYEIGNIETEAAYDENDIVNYLIDSGTSIDLIQYILQ